MSTEEAPKQAPQDSVVIEPATNTVTGAEVAETGIPIVCETTEGEMSVLLPGFW